MFPIKAFKLKELFFHFLGLLFIAMVLLYPDQCINAAKEGLNMSLYLVLPSLFPFMVISSYIVQTLTLPDFLCKPAAKLLGMHKNCSVPFILGLISGYPVGAILTADAIRNKMLTVEEGNRLLPLCNASGPLFTVGVVGGGMLGSYLYGYVLYGIQIASILLVCLLTRKKTPDKISRQSAGKSKTGSSFVNAIDKSVHNILNVCGLIIFFSVVCQILKISGLAENLFPYPPLLYGILEITNGMNKIVLGDGSMQLKLSLISALCGFSGICIFLQAQTAVKGTGLTLKKYVLYKLLIACVSFAITWLAFPHIPAACPTFASGQTAVFSAPYLAFSYICIILFTLICHSARRIKGKFFDNKD